MENLPVYILYHRPGSVWLSSRPWYTILFTHWWPVKWGTCDVSGTLVDFARNRGQEYRFSAATAAIYYVLSLLVDLGYTINITKFVLYPTTSVEYLGLTVDSLKQAFIVPGRKIEALAVLRKNILGCKNWHKSESPAGISGKCISLSLGAPAAKQFIREISHATASANNNGRVSLTPALREELSYWQLLDPWQDCLPWRDEKHVRLSFSTDASGFG